MNKDLHDLEDKIKKARKDTALTESEEREYEARSTGMRAGSEFMAYIFAGGLVGWGIGQFAGYEALWIILFVFAGFGLGIWRASQIMK